MKKKSKLGTFILSIIPGLGHIYLGFAARGALFMLAVIAIPAILLILTSGRGRGEELMLITIPLVWLAAMVDSMILVDKVNNAVNDGIKLEDSSTILPDYSTMAKQNKKVIAMVLSIIPGAGHLYLGLQKQGIELMASFLLTFYLTDWLRLSILMVFAPIIWFAAMFDVMHKVSGDRVMKDDAMFSDKWFRSNASIIGEGSFLRDKHKVLGYILVFMGGALVVNRIIFPLLDKYLNGELRNNIQTGIVALLLILGGIKLVLGSKVKIKEDANL